MWAFKSRVTWLSHLCPTLAKCIWNLQLRDNKTPFTKGCWKPKERKLIKNHHPGGLVLASITFLTHDRLKCASIMCQLLGRSLSGRQNPSQIFPWGKGQGWRVCPQWGTYKALFGWDGCQGLFPPKLKVEVATSWGALRRIRVGVHFLLLLVSAYFRNEVPGSPPN